MSFEKITVIVPVYNVEKYIEKCVDSLLNQNYPFYEIILVDDGSTDRSGLICDNYDKENENVTVIHKANGGLSDARNAGIKVCHTKYVVFVDSDDYVDEDFLTMLWEAKKSYSADIVCSPLIFEYETGKSKPLAKFNDFVTSGIKAQEYSLRSRYTGVSACAKLFRTDYLIEYPYPKGEINEDLYTTFWHFGLASKVAFISSGSYHYVQRFNSISYADINNITVKKSIEVCKHFMEYSKNDDITRASVNRIFKLVSEVCKLNGKFPSKERKELQNILKQYVQIALTDQDNSKKEKVKMYLLSSNVVTFWIFRKLQLLNRRRFI